MTRSYQRYLRLDSLLDLQHPITDWTDERMFIVVHQVYELWFSIVIEQIGAAVRSMTSDEDAFRTTARSLDRCVVVERMMVDHFALLDTLDPLEFSRLRAELAPASGHQSEQFATVIALSGGDERSDGLWSAYCSLATRWGVPLPLGEGHAARVRIENLAAVYRDRRGSNGMLWVLAEKLLDHDANIALWRYRHSLSAHRQIGTQRGTGGLTVADLGSRFDHRLYPDLWSVRDGAESNIS